MAGTKEGGKAAAATNKAKYGDDFYARIGALGGKAGRTGGFAADVTCDCNLYQWEHFVRQCAGKKGGLISSEKKKGE